MQTLLFGGFVFPNQSVLEGQKRWGSLWDFLFEKLWNCYQCQTEWLFVLFFMGGLFVLFFIIYHFFKNPKSGS